MVPTDKEQEILVKTTLMTFNDANLTGNYGVWKLSGINVSCKQD